MKSLFFSLCFGALFILTSCAQKEDKDISTTTYSYDYEVVVPDLQIAWGMAFLPDGSMLITEKNGELIHYSHGEKQEIEGISGIYGRGQGGLLDVALHPDYESNGWIYITFASTLGDGDGGNTALIRGKLENGQFVDQEQLYKASPNSTAGQHFGSRIAFDDEGYLYFTIGDRGNRDENPQDITRDGGKTYRLNDDGTIPSDNPFTDQENAKQAVYSFGHRNAQGMMKHPESGEIWLHEHGPQGGDEINVIKKGANYGWPEVTYGINYSGTSITDETSGPDFEDPIHYWDPSIAPSGMALVTSDKYPGLRGNLLVGSLKFQHLEHLVLDGKEVKNREKLLENIGRVRNVKQGPDGFIYLSIEATGIVKLISQEEEEEKTGEYTTPEKTGTSPNSELVQSISRGSEIYSNFCASCHLASGQGIQSVFPPLNQANWLTDKRRESIHAIKYGLQGPIEVNGNEYDNLMPALGLSDREVADVMNYIFNAWDNDIREPVSVEEVADVEK